MAHSHAHHHGAGPGADVRALAVALGLIVSFMAAAFAHLITDLWAFVATLIAGIVILATGFQRADAIASLVAVVLMVRAAWGLLRGSAVILLEGTPEGVDLDVVRPTVRLPGFSTRCRPAWPGISTSSTPRSNSSRPVTSITNTPLTTRFLTGGQAR